MIAQNSLISRAGLWGLMVRWEGPGSGKSFLDTPRVHPWSLSARASCFALPSPSLDSFQNVPRQLLLRRLERLLLGLYLLHPCSRVLEGLRKTSPTPNQAAAYLRTVSRALLRETKIWALEFQYSRSMIRFALSCLSRKSRWLPPLRDGIWVSLF